MTEEKMKCSFNIHKYLMSTWEFQYNLEFIMKIPMVGIGMYSPSVHENVHKDSMTVIHMQW